MSLTDDTFDPFNNRPDYVDVALGADEERTKIYPAAQRWIEISTREAGDVNCAMGCEVTALPSGVGAGAGYWPVVRMVVWIPRIMM